jgi:hypothetical protein
MSPQTFATLVRVCSWALDLSRAVVQAMASTDPESLRKVGDVLTLGAPLSADVEAARLKEIARATFSPEP